MSEPFTLRRDPKPTRRTFPQAEHRQAVLFCGLNDSPGQENLFETDGPPQPELPRARTNPRWTFTGGKCGRKYQLEGTGYCVEHCGHPTANFPYAGIDPEGTLIVSHSGYAFRLLAHALDAVEAIADGKQPPTAKYGRLFGH